MSGCPVSCRLAVLSRVAILLKDVPGSSESFSPVHHDPEASCLGREHAGLRWSPTQVTSDGEKKYVMPLHPCMGWFRVQVSDARLETPSSEAWQALRSDGLDTCTSPRRFFAAAKVGAVSKV